jgi:hypothetical protein
MKRRSGDQKNTLVTKNLHKDRPDFPPALLGFERQITCRSSEPISLWQHLMERKTCRRSPDKPAALTSRSLKRRRSTRSTAKSRRSCAASIASAIRPTPTHRADTVRSRSQSRGRVWWYGAARAIIHTSSHSGCSCSSHNCRRQSPSALTGARAEVVSLGGYSAGFVDSCGCGRPASGDFAGRSLSPSQTRRPDQPCACAAGRITILRPVTFRGGTS